MQRRNFLTAVAAAPLAAAPAAAGFRFLHLTDLHIQPELHAVDGCRMCFDHARQTSADFALLGGDLVFDVMAQPLPRAKALWSMFGENIKRLETKIHPAVGNHDVFGWNSKSGIASDDPGYGKKMFEDQVGPRYRSFNHQGWHFIILDSIQPAAAPHYFAGGIDDDQLSWLKADLAKVGPTAPIVVSTHIPLVSAAPQILDGANRHAELMIVNARAVLDLLWQHNLKMVLQGHTHICENVEYNGCQFITGGAVSGNWWKGKRLFHPEGYGVIDVKGDQATWSYRSYGFQADPA